MTGEIDVALLEPGPTNKRLNFLEVARTPVYALLRDSEPSAARPNVQLTDFNKRAWALFGRHTHPTLYEAFMRRSKELGVLPRDIYHVTTEEEAAHLVLQHDCVAFLTMRGSWRVAEHDLTIRPLAEVDLTFRTALVTRADDETRLTSEYNRAAVRKLEGLRKPRQQQLALTASKAGERRLHQ